jgi:hypothetical protein
MSISADQWLEHLKNARGWSPAADDRFIDYFRSSYDLPADWNRIRKRYLGMAETHSARFSSPDLCAARAPGRVNLIGEHTDYNGLPVFPMAVNRDMAAIFAPREDRKVVVVNTSPEFPERSFDIEQSVSPYPTGDWGNYCKAAVQGVLDHYRQRRRGAESGSLGEPYGGRWASHYGDPYDCGGQHRLCLVWHVGRWRGPVRW